MMEEQVNPFCVVVYDEDGDVIGGQVEVTAVSAEAAAQEFVSSLGGDGNCQLIAVGESVGVLVYDDDLGLSGHFRLVVGLAAYESEKSSS